MSFFRALLLLLIVVQASAIQPALLSAATVDLQASAGLSEEHATQVRVLETAYNLLMDRYVHPIDSAALLRAGWEDLARDAAGKAISPGPAPAFSGDRSADLELGKA